MLIREFVDTTGAYSTKVDNTKLVALATFLAGRAEDTTAKKEISQQAFVDLAKDLGVNITPDSLAELSNQDPLSNVIEPVDPNLGVVRFKGNTEAATGMSVDQARAVVDSNAKQALKRRM